MFICSACSFATTRRREWDRHHDRYGHDLNQRDEEQDSLEDSDKSNEEMQDVDIEAVNEAFNLDADTAFLDISQTNTEPDEEPPPSPAPDPDPDPWFPFKSRAHYYLTVLYHGSHRRYQVIVYIQHFSNFNLLQEL